MRKFDLEAVSSKGGVTFSVLFGGKDGVCLKKLEEKAKTKKIKNALWNKKKNKQKKGREEERQEKRCTYLN